MTDSPAMDVVDIRAIIREEFAQLLPVLKQDLHEFAESRLQQIAQQKMDEAVAARASERHREYTTIETSIKAALETRFDQLGQRLENRQQSGLDQQSRFMNEVIGMASTVSGIKADLASDAKRRSDQISAVKVNADESADAIALLNTAMGGIKRELYGSPDDKDAESLLSLVRRIRDDQERVKDKLDIMERDSTLSKQQLQEASTFIANRRSIESALLRAGKWAWRNKVKGVATIALVTASGGAGLGVIASVAEVVMKVLQP